MAKGKNFWVEVLRIAATIITSLVTALTTTSCMGYGPLAWLG